MENYYHALELQDNSDPTAKQSTGRRGSNAGYPYAELSPTGRSTVPIGDSAGDYNWLRRVDGGFPYRARNEFGRRHDTRPNNQNFVDIEKIRLGLDVRTTVSAFHDLPCMKPLTNQGSRLCCATFLIRLTKQC